MATHPTPPPGQPAEPPQPQRPDADELRRRHDAYVWRVNAAAAAGREKLAHELADIYLDEYLDDALGGPPQAPST